MPTASPRPKWNPLIAIGGLLVLAALAIGLLTGGAKSVSAQYGPPEPPPITNFTIKPLAPKAGKGFKASFSTPGAVDYRIYAIDKIDNRFILARGRADGAETTTTIGKQLKPGRYFLYAGRKMQPVEKNPDTGLPYYYDVKQRELIITR
jgi:hypothetical protein